MAYSYYDESRLRTGQKDALDVIIENLRAGRRYTSIVLPCGYGKSAVIRLASLLGQVLKLTCCSLVLSPGEDLRDQIVDGQKLLEWEREFGVQRAAFAKNLLSYSKLTGKNDLSLGYRQGFDANDEGMLSATIQLANTNTDVFAQWIRTKQQATGKKVIVFVDETQYSSTSNTWGDTIRALSQAGAHVVVLTATAFRHDKDMLEGFRTEDVPNSHRTVRISRGRPGASRGTVEIDIFEVGKTLKRIVPDCHVRFRQAWAEGVICHFNHHRIDVGLQKAGIAVADEEVKMISDMSDSQATELLGRIVRSPLVIEECARCLVEKLNYVRRGNPEVSGNCCAVVFGANDSKSSSDGADAHQAAIEEAIKRIAPHLRTRIITSSSMASDPKGMEAFQGGHVDVAIFKKMGGLGIDRHEIKVVLDLSPDRSAAMFIQRAMRASRPVRDRHGRKAITTAHLITPADPRAIALFEKLIAEENGVEVTESEKHIDTYEVQKQESPAKPVFTPVSTARYGAADTSGQRATVGEVDMVEIFLDEFEDEQDIVLMKTYPDIHRKISSFLDRISKGGKQPQGGQITAAPPTPPPSDPPGGSGLPDDINDRILELRAYIRKTINRLCYHRLEELGINCTPGSPGHDAERARDSFGRAIGPLWVEFYELNGLAPNTNLSKLRHIPTLELLQASAASIRKSWEEE